MLMTLAEAEMDREELKSNGSIELTSQSDSALTSDLEADHASEFSAVVVIASENRAKDCFKRKE